MSSTAQRTSIILLDENAAGDVFVIPKDRDKFILTVEEAVRACRASAESIRFSDQFQSLLDKLAVWLHSHRERIKSAHLTIRESDILLLVMQRQTRFDQELVDALTELDLEIANSEAYDLIKLNTLSTPPVSTESAKAFLSSGHVYTYAK